MVEGSITICPVPGELWTVSPLGLAFVPRLFARNGDWISYIDTEHGECAGQGWCYCRREDTNRLPHNLLQPTWR